METYEDSTVVKQASEKLNNTFIIDEIQSDWIQDIQKFGTKEDYQIIKGSDMTEEFIEKNFGDKYELKISKFSTMKQTLEETGLQYNKVLYIKPRPGYSRTTSEPLTSIDTDRYYTFSKTRITGASGFKTKEDAQKNAENKGIANLPIIESKKYVELMLNSLIKEAVLNGTDSIGITNGQIQGDRYEGQGDDESEGLKKFYDTIVYDQLNKIAKEYNVELETIDIQNPDDIEGGSEKEELSSTRRKVRSAQDEGYVLQKIPVEILQELTNNVSVPGHASFYSSTGKGQGVDYILNNIDQEYREAVGMGNVTTDYYIWSKEPITLDIQKIENLEEEFKKIVWDMPIVPTKDASENEVVKSITNLNTLERDSILKQFHIGGEESYPYGGESLNDVDLIQYTEYLQNYKQPEGVDIGYDKDPEVLIKLKFPKKLQKDILSKPIKLTKLEAQTNKMLT